MIVALSNKAAYLGYAEPDKGFTDRSDSWRPDLPPAGYRLLVSPSDLPS